MSQIQSLDHRRVIFITWHLLSVITIKCVTNRYVLLLRNAYNNVTAYVLRVDATWRLSASHRERDLA